MPTSPEALSGFLSSPATETNLASYNAITDTDSIINEVPDNYRPYAAGGGNIVWLHVCMPGKAAQTREQWLDTNSRLFIRRCAEYVYDKSVQYAFPLRRLTVDMVRAGVMGYCAHWDVSLAFLKSTHTDVGRNFPWDAFNGDLEEIVAKNTVWPPFDPARGKYSVYPFDTGKQSIHAYSVGGDVRYAKGVMRNEVARFARWFVATGQAGDGMVAFVNPADGRHHYIRRADALTMFATTAERLDPNWDAFDGTMHDATLLMQAGFGGATFDGRTVGPLFADGVIGPAQTWPFLDSLADTVW